MELDDEVLQDLYQAAAGMLPWKVALDKLDAAVGSVVSQFVVFDKTTGHLVLSEQPDHTPVVAVLDYIREYHRIDPHTTYIQTRPIGETVHTPDVFPPGSMVNHPFYRDFWSSYNVRSFLGAKVAEDDKHVAILALLRYHDVPAHSAAEIALAGRYFSHLVTAFRIAKFLQRLQFTAVVGHNLMAGCSRPMILIDNDRAILAANVAARAFLDDGKTLFAKNEVLHCRHPAGQRALLAALYRVQTQAGSQVTALRRTAARLKGSGKVDTLCSIWDMRPELSLGAFGSQPAALITLALPSTDGDLDLTLIGSMFELTPAEARLAGALMRGETLACIAKALRVSIATVRTQLLSIFAKTETHRQAELIELLMRVTSL